MAQTALETFWEQIAEILPFSVDSVTAIKLYEKYQECKQIEKEQHQDTWLDSAASYYGDDYIGKQQTFDQYYTQTYAPGYKTKPTEKYG